MLTNKEHQNIKDTNLSEFSIEISTIIKILILFLNAILLLMVLPSWKLEYDFLFILIVVLIPVFTVSAIFIPNATFKKTVGIILSILGTLLVTTTSVFIYLLYYGSRNEYWEFAMIILSYMCCHGIGIIIEGVFLIYEANRLTLARYVRVRNINSVDALEALV